MLRYLRCYPHQMTALRAVWVLVILLLMYNVQNLRAPFLHKDAPSRNSTSTQYNVLRPHKMLHDNIQQQSSTKQHPESKDSCSPHRSVSYVKIHKTGSGALHNLFSRLALRYNLTTAFIKSGSKYGGVFPEYARLKHGLNQAPLKNYINYNVFVDHTRFDKATQLEFMANDVRFITQIRNPFSQAESAFHHFKYDSKYKLEKEANPLTSLLTSTSKYITSLGGQCCNKNNFPVTCNFQAFTLGYENVQSNSNMTHFNAYLQQLDSELFFVSLLEYRDESMVLLRRKMCWHIRDVLTIHSHKTKRVIRKQKDSHNARTDQVLEQAKEQATEQAMTQATARTLHRQLSALDYALYEHFQEKLLSMVNEQGADFQEEVHLYRQLNARFYELCCRMCEEFSALQNNSITSIRCLLHEGGENIPATAFYPAFRLSYVDCLLQKSKEPYVKTVVKLNQYPDVCSSEQQELAKYKLDKQDCDFSNHVYPGYHINKFKQEILNKDICLGNYYHG